MIVSLILHGQHDEYPQGYPYAELQGGDRCSCGSDYGVYGKTDGCDLPCQAPYTDFKCGGVDKNAIFSTGIGKGMSIHNSRTYLIYGWHSISYKGG